MIEAKTATEPNKAFRQLNAIASATVNIAAMILPICFGSIGKEGVVYMSNIGQLEN
jgi:hypothetical protein